MNLLRSIGLLLLPFTVGTKISAQSMLDELKLNLEHAIEDGKLIGAQVAAVRDGRIILSQNYGSLSPDSEAPVTSDTLFLIGSCSKPFASTCLLSLMTDPANQLSLDSRIDKWLPEFASVGLENGQQSRPPTIEELLSHRAGIFSQKVKITRDQARWLFTYDHTLETAVHGISEFPLLDHPGVRYAYSGAGYCIAGRVAEVATGKPFERILQEQVCIPLSLKRTTFFPTVFLPGASAAVGLQDRKAPHELGEKHRFPLIGGSLYSTATDMATFAHAVSLKFTSDKAESPLSVTRESIMEAARIRSRESGYGLGWKVRMQNGTPATLQHSGSLQAYRAWIFVDIESRIGMAACWTTGTNGEKLSVTKWLERQQYLLKQ